MDYLRHNEKRKSKRGAAPTGTRPLIDGSAIHEQAKLVRVVEMEGRTFRHFRAVTTDDMVTK